MFRERGGLNGLRVFWVKGGTPEKMGIVRERLAEKRWKKRRKSGGGGRKV